MTTKAQKWARKRNFNKRRLLATLTTLRNLAEDKTLTKSERSLVRYAASKVEPITKCWDSNTRISRRENNIRSK